MPTTLIQPPTKDGGMSSALPNTVYNGGVQEMEIGDGGGGNNLRAHCRFDFSSIPPGSRVVSATLELYKHSLATNNITIGVFRCLRDWVETQKTWNIWKAANNWTTAGCSGVGTDYEDVLIGSLSILNGDAVGWKSWVLNTAAIEAMIGGSFTNVGGFFLRKTDGVVGNSRRFYGKEYATTDAHPERAPKLTIVWTPPLGRLPDYTVDALQGGVRIKSTLDGMANRLWTRYTPVGGSITRSPNAEDLSSQANYGIKEKPLTGGNASAGVADQISRTALEFTHSPLMADIQLDPTVIVRDALGEIVPLEEIRPNRWLYIENLPFQTGIVYTSLVDDPAAHYIEERTYDEASGLHIVTSKERFVEGLVAKIAGRG